MTVFLPFPDGLGAVPSVLQILRTDGTVDNTAIVLYYALGREHNLLVIAALLWSLLGHHFINRDYYSITRNNEGSLDGLCSDPFVESPHPWTVPSMDRAVSRMVPPFLDP